MNNRLASQQFVKATDTWEDSEGFLTDFLSDKGVAIAVHTYGHSIAYEMEAFLRSKVKSLLLIGHPFSIAKSILGHPLNSSAIQYERGVITAKFVAPEIIGPDLLLWVKDFFLTLFFVARSGHGYDIFVGIDNLNALAGLLLRRVGLVRTVIYYTIDYAPKRFENQILNRIYHWIDKLCCYYSDCVWNVEKIMVDKRNELGVLKTKSAPQIVVPLGNRFNEIERLPFERINRYDMVYMGALLEKQGIQLAIDSLPEIMGRVPNARLLIIGAGNYEDRLRDMVTERNLEDRVSFLGYIESHADVENILRTCASGLAPYTEDPDNYSLYCNPGKVKVYAATGLPIIISRVPQVARDIERERAGIAINYDKDQLVQAAIKLLTDDTFYLECRANVVAFGARYAWDHIYAQAFKESAAILERQL